MDGDKAQTGLLPDALQYAELEPHCGNRQHIGRLPETAGRKTRAGEQAETKRDHVTANTR